MSNSPKFESGNYVGRISIGKEGEKNFTCNLTFNRGRIDGIASQQVGAFKLTGTYKDTRPYSVNMDIREAFGIQNMSVKGNYSLGNEILGMWYNAAGAPGGDLYLNFKKLSPEEAKKLEAERKNADMMTLMGMGFEEWACELALESVVGTIDQKLNWLLEGNHENRNQGGGGNQKQPQK